MHRRIQERSQARVRHSVEIAVHLLALAHNVGDTVLKGRLCRALRFALTARFLRLVPLLQFFPGFVSGQKAPILLRVFLILRVVRVRCAFLLLRLLLGFQVLLQLLLKRLRPCLCCVPLASLCNRCGFQALAVPLHRVVLRLSRRRCYFFARWLDDFLRGLLRAFSLGGHLSTQYRFKIAHSILYTPAHPRRRSLARPKARRRLAKEKGARVRGALNGFHQGENVSP